MRASSTSNFLVTFPALACLALVACASRPAPLTWPVDRLTTLGGHAVEVWGAPRVEPWSGGEALCFDGRDDGIYLPANPLAGWPRFTIEVLVRPDADGDEEQRFLHLEDGQGRRVLLETRRTAPGAWALDSFLLASEAQRLTLLDRRRSQPAGDWYWAALSYDGRTMRHYVNAEVQGQGAIAFPAMGPGTLSLGVRQNRKYWFKGCIAALRFTAEALDTGKLRRF